VTERAVALARKLGALGYRAQEVALCLFRKWWRPTTCSTAFATLAVNGVYLPLKTGTAADLTGLAALLAALSPFAIARSVELIKGRADNA
jgi:hypothetical protein